MSGGDLLYDGMNIIPQGNATAVNIGPEANSGVFGNLTQSMLSALQGHSSSALSANVTLPPGHFRRPHQ